MSSNANQGQQEYQETRYNPNAVSFEPLDLSNPNLEDSFIYNYGREGSETQQRTDVNDTVPSPRQRNDGDVNCATNGDSFIMLQDIVNDPARIDEDVNAIWNEYEDSLMEAYKYEHSCDRRRRKLSLSVCLVTVAVASILGLVSYAVFRNDDGSLVPKTKLSFFDLSRMASLEERCGGDDLEESSSRWRSCAKLCLTLSRSEDCPALSTSELCHAISVWCGPIFDAVDGSSRSGNSWQYFESDIGMKNHYRPPPPPSDISTICKKGSDGGGDASQYQVLSHFMDCAGMCSVASCCTSSRPEDNCFLSNVERCWEYAPYCTLPSRGGGGAVRGSAPAVVERVCRADYLRDEGWGDCFAACSTAACCFPNIFRGNDGREICAEDEEWCDSYGACRLLADIKVVDDDKKELVSQVCTIEKVNEGVQGWKRCFDMCLSRECCHTDNNAGKCGAQGPTIEWCHGYDSCKVIFDDSEDDGNENQVNSSTILSNSSISLPPNVIYHNGTNITSLPPNKNQINTTNGISVPPPGATDEEILESLNTHCAISQVATTKGFAACGVICMERRCCFDAGPLSCYSYRKEWCDQFDLCNNLNAVQQHNDQRPFANLANSEEAFSQEQVVDGNDDDDVALVARWCTMDKLSLIIGQEECRNTCQKRKCCWETDVRYGCYNAKQEWCEEFAMCENLNTMTVVSSP